MAIRLFLHEPCFSCNNADVEVNSFVGGFTFEQGYAHVHEISCTHECVCKKIDGMEYIDERFLYGQGEADKDREERTSDDQPGNDEDVAGLHHQQHG